MYVAGYRFLLGDFRPYVWRTDDAGETWTLLTDGTNGIPADQPVRVVREDPGRPGLLYAGTEFGMFVSFDDGESWQSFQQNLPVTPITDIAVVGAASTSWTFGAAYVFRYDGASWNQEAKLEADVPANADHFAEMVAAEGDADRTQDGRLARAVETREDVDVGPELLSGGAAGAGVGGGSRSGSACGSGAGVG